jgi:hypothetical protein
MKLTYQVVTASLRDGMKRHLAEESYRTLCNQPNYGKTHGTADCINCLNIAAAHQTKARSRLFR